MSDIELDAIRSGYNLSKINSNFEKVGDVINDDVLHRSGGNNTMSQELDMDSNKIINTPRPVESNEVANKKYVDDTLSGVEFSEAAVVQVTGPAIDKVMSQRAVSELFELRMFQSPTDGGLTRIQTSAVVGGKVYEVRNTSDDSLATIYTDESGSSEIIQNGTDNKSASDGSVEFYIADGDYYVEIDSVESGLLVSRLRAFDSVSDVLSASYLSKYVEGTRIEWQGYYAQSDGGSNWGLLRFGAHTADGGSVFSIDSNTYIEANLKGKSVSVHKFGARGDNSTSDLSSIQAAIDYVNATSSADTRGKVSTNQGSAYLVDGDLQLRDVCLDLSGSYIFLSGTASILAGNSSAMNATNARVLCLSGYTGTVIKRDASISGVANIQMTGRLFIQRLGTIDTSAAIAVDITGMHRSKIDIEARNFNKGVYAYPTSSSLQTYYNDVSIRGSSLFYGIHLETDAFDICNGNNFPYVSLGSVEKGIFIEAATGKVGPSSNNFKIAYIENIDDIGLHILGDCRYNNINGGLIETVNDVIGIHLEGARFNTIVTSVAPASVAKAFTQTNGEANTLLLNRYGNWLNWSEDVGPGADYTSEAGNRVYIKGLPNNEDLLVFDTDTSNTLTLDSSTRTVWLTGTGSLDFIDATNAYDIDEVDFIGSGTATITEAASGSNNIRLKDGLSVAPPNRGIITLKLAKDYSASWLEKSRGV